MRGGYEFNPNWSVEGTYTDLGQTFSGTAATLPAPPAAITSGSQSTKAWSLAAVGKAPITQNRRLKAYGKLGVARWDSKINRTIANVAQPQLKEKGTDPVVGLGLEYDVSNQWTVRGGYERYFNVGKNNNMLNGTVEKDVDALTIGASFNF